MARDILLTSILVLPIRAHVRSHVAINIFSMFTAPFLLVIAIMTSIGFLPYAVITRIEFQPIFIVIVILFKPDCSLLFVGRISTILS